ncbi:MAG: LLM class flavin-dependent oxidoreductase, partial [Candidatus Bathyarchaeia archaeon]
EFAGFKMSRENRGSRIMEQIDILRKAWSSPRFSFKGKYYEYSDLSVTPKPVQKPHPPIWVGASGRLMIRRTAKNGLPLVASPRHHVSELKNHYQIYKEALKESGKTVEELPVIRYAYVAETQQKAEADARDPVVYIEKDLYGAWAKWRELRDDKGQLVQDKQAVTFETHRERFLIGTPEFCVREIEKYRRELGMNHLICWTHMPGLSHEKAMKSIRLFAKEVMPQFR